MDRQALYRIIPKVDRLLDNETVAALTEKYGARVVTEVIREETERLRGLIRDATDEKEAEQQVEQQVRRLPEKIEEEVHKLFTPKIRKVINATGTILHTNLGRAPLSEEQARKVAETASCYSSLEYDLETGERGDRCASAEALFCRLTGAEAAMAVNNNAAALLLILNTLAKGGDVIVSRGELVEIGGKFRIPDVMEQSGARLAEVGTTNKTRLQDYEQALTGETRAVLKVHTSNYRIVGFTESVPAETLKEFTASAGLPLIWDLGSGVIIDPECYGLAHEPTVREAVSAADVICFSGDKLFGGPQAGIILGRRELIGKMKKNPLSRALRPDKFVIAALELVLMDYLDVAHTAEKIPVIRMISESEKSVRARAEILCAMILESAPEARVTVEPSHAQAGGGALPGEEIPSAAVVIRPGKLSSSGLTYAMRHMRVPVVARTSEDAVWLDVRTIDQEDFGLLAEMLGEVLA